MPDAPWITVEDYRHPSGWLHPAGSDVRARAYCERLERGEILFFPQPPFDLPTANREFLLSQQWAAMRMHKNVSYRPGDDTLRGASGDAGTIDRLHGILRSYTAEVTGFAAKFLAPYAGKWNLDFSSFRPFEEENRGLPLHKRNDLLHVDAFPSRPTRGGRILRIFTNLNPTKSRVWNILGDFESLARANAQSAGLGEFAMASTFSRKVQDWGGKMGIRGMGRTAYDKFMLRFHDYLKANQQVQQGFGKVRLEFPPSSTWLVFTDGVAHAAMSGQYALEQTFLIPPDALVSPERAPYRILEKIAGLPLVS